MSLLIIGATGTLGRQIALQALTKGYKVRCLVRNFQKAQFLKDWGAELIYGDLAYIETIPNALKGVTAIIDVSTNRITDQYSLKKIEWDSKLCLIKAAKVAKIKRFIFFSTQTNHLTTNIPLIEVKNGIEQKLIESKIPYTIFQLTGFYQGLIEQYTIPILENLSIWTTNENNSISYIDTQDISKICLRSLQLPKTENKTFILTGKKSWKSSEIIKLCEILAGQKANIKILPVFLIQFFGYATDFFAWSQNISDRLSFVKLLNLKQIETSSNLKLFQYFKMNVNDLISLDDYFLEYFIRLIKRLRDINFEDIQKQKNLLI